MKIIKEVNMSLLNRKRITAQVNSKITPKKEEVAKEIAKLSKVDEKAVKIKHIYSHFGSNVHKIIAHVYKNEKDLLKYDPKKKVKKEKG